ncbi:lipase member H [Paramormyrops kingsleyae]|uniref:Lipase, member Ia n=1 Tax=Paramormyrops kingsleyae TaxID=1676925 RepID=A0A3B3Q4D8_9TELE|nr:lipase member H [Paramormyrops kingsleyae]
MYESRPEKRQHRSCLPFSYRLSFLIIPMLPWMLVLLVSFALSKGQASECVNFTDLGIADSIWGTKLEVKLILHTRQNLNCGYLLQHENLTSQPLLNMSRPTTFIIHGYRPSGEPPAWLLDAVHLLAAQMDINIILVDWNRGATNINYFTVVKNTKKVAENVTAFIRNMKDHGASLSSIHMIGVSLGAHISGFVGANLTGQIGRITALDPAGPQFNGKPSEERLDPNDAQFVDVLHTDIDALGYRNPLGHIDFYPNGGTDQPGCPKTIFAGKSYLQCDHQRSVYLFLSSMNRTSACNITTYPCASYNDFLDGKCLSCSEFFPQGCPVLGYYISEWKDVLLQLNQTTTYFSTTSKLPYCKTSYKLEMVTWNSQPRWATVTVKLHGKGEEAEAKINHKATKFQQYKTTNLLAQFDKDIHPVRKMSVQFSTGNLIGPRYKLRLLYLRLSALEHPDRPSLCRYDVILNENVETSFRPIPCHDSNF